MRQEAGQRRRFKKVLLICALGMGILLLPIPAWWMVRYCYVERAVRAFQSNPSQAGADKLIYLLDKRSPTQAQAARILKLLLRPKVVTRRAYAIGRKPTISTLLPFRLRFNTTMTRRVDILADGQDFLMPQSSRFNSLSTGSHVWTLPAAPDNYGKFSVELRFSYSLAAPPSWLYPRNPVAQLLYDLLDKIRPQRQSTGFEERPYHVGFNVPVDISVVPEAEAERVQLLSSPELDNRMRDALRTDAPRWYLHMHIFARRLPANMVFACHFELPDGTRVKPSWPEDQHLTGCAGREFEVNLSLGDIQVNRTGVHDAKLVFESDPNYALDEPTIKAIWNGRLEFPIHFTITSEPNTGR
jgi:hypothetical protein